MEASAKVTQERPGSRGEQAGSGLTFFCTTSCQLILRKNLCSMTSVASLGPPPSLGRDGHQHPPPGAAGAWETGFRCRP